MKPTIYAIIYKEDESADDFSIRHEIGLTKEEEEQIENILKNHETEGGSYRADMKSILSYMAENINNSKKHVDTKNCHTCNHFYECDNMGYFEECLPDMKYYKE